MKLVSTEGDIVLTRLDEQSIAIEQHEVLLFACVRNERLRLPYFIDYHRRLGVDRFFIVDNGSDDGTVDFLLEQPNVHVYHTSASYAASRCGVDWLNIMLMEYAVGHWALTLDADELFVYPMCETIDLHGLVRYLGGNNFDAVTTFMLDMYSELPIRQAVYEQGQRFKDVCGYFDADTYHELDANGIPIRGGPRHRLFWQGQAKEKNSSILNKIPFAKSGLFQRLFWQGKTKEKPSPILTKVPFAKWRENLAYEASTHVLRGVRLAQLTGVIQHYKFFSDFYDRVKNEVLRQEHWDDAAQYNLYWQVLEHEPDLSATYSGSVKYEDSDQLLRLELMKAPERYYRYANLLAGEGVSD